MCFHYSINEPYVTDEKLEYEARRAARRARSKATVIGMFADAKKNIYELKTISGFEDKFLYFESFRDEFCDALEAHGCISDQDYSVLLSEMNGYSHVGDMLYNEKDQKAELAAYGLILYERLTLAEAEKISYIDFFSMHEELALCRDLMSDMDVISTRARAAAHARHAKDPKQKDKAMVRECWNEWQRAPLDRDGKKKYKGKSAFALDMLKSWENLESQAVIEGWCRVWEKEAKNLSLPAK